MFRSRLHTGRKAFKFEYSLSDVHIHLNSTSTVAVSVDNVSLVWQRGHRSVATKVAHVVEKLDQQTGALTRTASVTPVNDLVLPCTLFRRGADEDGKWDAKASELIVHDADEEAEEAVLCIVPFELSEHAVSPSLTATRTRLELPLGGGLGSISFTVCGRMLSGAADDACSNAGSEVSDVREVLDASHWAHEDGASQGAACSGHPSPAEGASSHAHRLPLRMDAEVSVEARWQEVYELERSKADALTIEGLQRDLNALIRDKQRLSEENLKLRSTLNGMLPHHSPHRPPATAQQRPCHGPACTARLRRTPTKAPTVPAMCFVCSSAARPARAGGARRRARI